MKRRRPTILSIREAQSRAVLEIHGSLARLYRRPDCSLTTAKRAWLAAYVLAFGAKSSFQLSASDDL